MKRSIAEKIMGEKKGRTMTRRESIGLIAGGAGLLATQPGLMFMLRKPTRN